MTTLVENIRPNSSMWIDGKAVPSVTGNTANVLNPATGKIIASVPLASREDVKRAADAAKVASRSWSGKPVAERSKILFAIADILRKNNDRLAQIETNNHGSPIRKTRNFDVGLTAEIFEYYGSVIRGIRGEVNPVGPQVLDLTVREPVGVAGLIIPWNFPLLMASWKIAPALAAGNTVVVKPASVTPLTTIEFAMLTEKILPEGVLNVVTGPGDVIGEEMISNNDIDMISLTGEVETGKRVLELASKTVKRTVMELGGKNPLVVLSDADLDAAVEGAIFGSFFNSGQVCATSSRIYVHNSAYSNFVRKFVAAARQLVVDDPMEMVTDMGPVVSNEHKQKVEGFIKKGIEEGAHLELGGSMPKKSELANGSYVMPTIFSDAKQDMQIVQQEIFGPVSTVLSFTSDDSMLEMVEGTRYGLSASLWTKDVAHATQLASKLNAGTVWINEHLMVYPETPWGGFKQSGIGKELSPHALDEYTRLKHISYDLTGMTKKPWYGLFNPHPLVQGK